MSGSQRAAAFVCLVLAASCTPRTVARAADGEVYEGRYIPARAYEAYARGALLEREGRWSEAAEAYREAAELDDAGAEPWTRLGAVLCATGAAGKNDATEAFARAEERDAASPPLARERGRCALRQGDAAGALARLRLAEVLGPDDTETALLIADALAALEDREDLARFLVARVLAPRPPRELVERLRALGRATKDESLLRLAAAAGASEPAQPSLAEIDRALGAGDLAGARRLALRARVTPGELALRAAALGRTRLAREQAELVSDADPEDVPSRVALLVVGDVTSRAALADALQESRAPGSARAGGATPLARLLLAELLRRRVGEEASLRVVGADERARPREDALEERVRARLAR